MFSIRFESLFILLKRKLFNSSIRLWHIIIAFGIVSIIVVVALILIYLNRRNREIENGLYSSEFHIDWFNGSPDGYQRAILGINGQIPSPRIIVEKGAKIHIKVKNKLSESTTIHWHGLHQMNSLIMDGVPGITQCPILSNETYLYEFSTNNQVGTYWYHSHSAIQYGDGLKGILIIKDPNDPWKDLYDDEDIIELTDWYHQPVYIYLKKYLYPGTEEPIPDTGLINGIGQFNCLYEKNCSYYHLFIKKNQIKRFRLINTSIYAKITLTIDEHMMRLIEVDGIYLDGNNYVHSIRLNPGQRYSILINGTQNSCQSYWIRALIHPFVTLNNQYKYSIKPNIYCILHYYSNIDDLPTNDPLSVNQLILNKSLIDGEIFSDELNLTLFNLSEYQLPTNDLIKTLTFNSYFKGKQPGFFYFNNQTFLHPTNQTLLSTILYENLTELNWPSTIQIEKDEIIDIIINNIDYAPHPFHLHGHHVWILAQGNTKDGIYNQSVVYNLNNPISRDTFTVNPYSYIVFRFKANNPGIWMMHCHNDWHLQLQMALLFIESYQQIKSFYFNQNLTNSIPLQCKHH